MANPYTFSKEQAAAVAPLANRVYSTFSESIKRKVPSTLWHSTPPNAREILLLPVRLTRLEKEEVLAVLEAQSSNPS